MRAARLDGQARDSALYFLQAVVEIGGLIEVGVAVNHIFRLALVEVVRVFLAEVVDLRHCAFGEPLDALSVLPESELCLVFFGNYVFA